MAAEVIQLVAKISADAQTFTGEINKVKKGLRETVNEAATATKDVASKVAVAAGAIGTALAAALGATALKAQDMRNALGEVSSTGVEDLNGLRDAAIDFSNKWSGVTATEFVRSAYDIKSAVSSLSDEAVTKFTEMSAITAKATKASAAEMSKAFAVAYGIFKPLNKELSDVEWADKFAGAMAYAANIFKTDGKEMADAIRSIGAVATAANVPLAEQTTILGMLQQTMPGSEAGTLYKAFLMNIAEGGKKLGIEVTDANGRLKAMPDILEAIKKKFPDLSQAAAQVKLKEALGSDEAVKFVLQMSGQVDDLRKNTVEMGGAFEKGSAVAVEMAEKMNTDKIELAKQQFGNLMTQIGELVLTALQPLIEKTSGFIVKVQEWIKANGPLAATLAKVALGAAALLAIVTAVASAVAVVAGVVAFFSSAALVAAAPIIGTIAIVIGVIVALAAAALLIYQNWDGIKDFFVQMWEVVKGAFVAVWEFLKGIVMGIANAAIAVVTAIWDGIKTVFTTAFNIIGGIVLAEIEIMKALFMLLFGPLIEIVVNFWNSIKGYFVEAFTFIADKVTAGWEFVKGIFVAAWQYISGIVVAVWTKIAEAFSTGFAYIANLVSQGWAKVVEMWNAAVDAIVSLAQKLWAPFQSFIDLVVRGWQFIFDKATEIFNRMWENLKAGWEAAKQGPQAFANWIIESIKNAVAKAMELLGELWEKAKNLPGAIWDGMKNAVGLGDGGDSGAIPAMASGGIVRKPTLALIGEAGPEAVIPLNGGAVPIDFGGYQSSNNNGTTIAPTSDVFNIYQQPGESTEQLAKRIAEYKMKRKGWSS